MSRLGDITTAVAAHVTTAFTNAGDTVTISTDPNAFDSLPADDFPVAIVLFTEDEPERLAFKQQRRRVNGEVHLCMVGDTITRETMDSRIESVRDLVFADPYLSASVDDITAEAGRTFSGTSDPKVYGSLEIATEEVY